MQQLVIQGGVIVLVSDSETSLASSYPGAEIVWWSGAYVTAATTTVEADGSGGAVVTVTPTADPRIACSLADYKQTKINLFNYNTSVLLAAGVIYPSGGTNYFALDAASMALWTTLYQAVIGGTLVAPVTITNTQGSSYTLSTTAAVIAFYAMVSSASNTIISGGQTIIAQVQAAADKPGVDAITDGRGTPAPTPTSPSLVTTFNTRSGAVTLLTSDMVIGMVTAVDGPTITFNAAAAPKHQVTLGGNRTLVVTNDQDGQVLTLILRQDATGGRTVTWWSGIRWPGGTPPTLATQANHEDAITIVRRSSGVYSGFHSGANMF